VTASASTWRRERFSPSRPVHSEKRKRADHGPSCPLVSHSAQLAAFDSKEHHGGWVRPAGQIALAPDPLQREVPVDGKDLEVLWAAHLDGEFAAKDVEATLATMVDDAYVNHVPVSTGGRGKDQLRRFYRDVFIPSWPEDLDMEPINRVVGGSQLVDELHVRFTHARRMEWLLPDVEATNLLIDVDFVVVVEFRDDKLACERIYWDHAKVLRDVGLLS
jgi:carboxymethylenebutenolidase